MEYDDETICEFGRSSVFRRRKRRHRAKPRRWLVLVRGPATVVPPTVRRQSTLRQVELKGSSLTENTNRKVDVSAIKTPSPSTPRAASAYLYMLFSVESSVHSCWTTLARSFRSERLQQNGWVARPMARECDEETPAKFLIS